MGVSRLFVVLKISKTKSSPEVPGTRFHFQLLSPFHFQCANTHCDQLRQQVFVVRTIDHKRTVFFITQYPSRMIKGKTPKVVRIRCLELEMNSSALSRLSSGTCHLHILTLAYIGSIAREVLLGFFNQSRSTSVIPDC